MALKMADQEQVLHTPMEWAQRKDRVLLTIVLEDCKEPNIEITDTGLHFKGKGGTENKLHEAKIEFFKEIDSKESKYAVLPRHISLILKKKDATEEHFWPRLLKEKTKVHWLKTDFNKWKDEDDSDYEGAGGGEGGAGDMDLESMMQNMGGMGGMGGMDAGGDMENDKESSDSDDEDLPDLE
ncbi:cytosolic prostaglandin-E synthase [Mytilus galloprovincialis]|nr:cytosolic prostaglandin-E synthase [Mytilus galloprovincialis]